MKTTILVAAVLALAAPAIAQDMSTLQYLTAKGAMVKANLQGQEVELSMAYKADGTYTASADGQELGGGNWKIDGDRLCTESQLGAACTPYPAGKKPGDTFDVQHPTLGKATVTINK